MKLESLRAVLASSRIRPDAYALDGEPADGRYVLVKRGRSWRVYLSTDEVITWERVCTSEDEACQVLLAILQSDPDAQYPAE